MVPEKLDRITSAINDSNSEYEQLLKLKPIYAIVSVLLRNCLISPTGKLRCCTAQLPRFRATVQILPWSATFAQLWQISGCFGANNLPFWGNLGANWTSEQQ